MVPGSDTKPSEENIVMFETAVTVAVVDVLCNSLMSEEHNIYLLMFRLFLCLLIKQIIKTMHGNGDVPYCFLGMDII